MNKILSIVTLFVLMVVPSLIPAQPTPNIFDVHTSAGQMGLTLTNFGVLGNGWNTINGEILPSCQYKQYTENLHEQIEHFSYAGLWIGGIVNGQRRVSTAIMDGVWEPGDEGFEFFATSWIDTALTVSHQDFLTDFKDYGNGSEDNNGITNHNPLGVDVQLETYAWNDALIDAFIILNYTITNHSDYDIENLYAGLWIDAAVANMNYTDIYTPGGGFTWYDNLDGYDESIDESGFSRDIGYQYDADGDNGWAESYIGVTMLGSSTPRPYVHSYYNQWTWTNSNNSDYPAYSMPLNDFERYEKLSSSVPQGTDSDLYNPDGYPSNPNNWLFLLSAGPFGSQIEPDSTWYLPPNESCNIVFAVVAGKWEGDGSESSERRTHLIENADWAQKIFDGEDINRNNILDAGEDLNEDGELTRYLIPPKPPNNLTAIWNYPMVTLNWNSPSEPVIGYNVYKSQEAYSGAFNILNTILITDTLYIDDSVFTDSTTSYYVVSVNDIEWESAPSNVVKDYSTPPEISFKYLSNPSVDNIEGDTSFTFPTRTFVLDVYDLDGNETITDLYYALDDTCETCWTHWDATYSSVTLTEIETGFHTFYIKAVDDFGMSSEVIYFPDISNTSEPDYWKVMPIVGDVLLVDDFDQDIQNNAQVWYRSALDTILDEENYSIWEIGGKLPYSDTDITANLNYFNHVIWYAAYTGRETYDEAGSSIFTYLINGGNMFLNIPEVKETTFPFFPISSLFTINTGGSRILPGRDLHAQVTSNIIPDLDLKTSQLIAINVKGFTPAIGSIPEFPFYDFEAQDIYHLQEPESGDTWTGTPNVCSVGKFIIAPDQESGKIALMTIPIHNGYNAVLEGNGSASKLIKFLLEEEFVMEEENPNQIIVENLNDWNLVGLPLEVEDSNYLTIFPESTEGTLFYYNGEQYLLEEELQMGNGYWLHFENEGSTQLAGTPINEMTLQLNEGWNLISGISYDIDVSNIIDDEGIIVPQTFYGFNVTYVQSDIIEKGKGYWVNSFQDGEITLVSGALAKTTSQDFSLNSNTISINGSELYFGVELSDKERLSYSLPPKPPAGAFDVRFKDGWRVVKDYGVVEVMPTTETLTITYDIMLNTGEHHNWVLSSETLDDYVLEDSGELIVTSAERFILERKAVVPETFTLHQNFPNPFNPITTLRYDLPSDALVTLTVFDMLGKEINQLVNTTQEAGFKSVQWDATDSMGRPVSAGVYLYQIEAGEFVQTKKMVLLK